MLQRLASGRSGKPDPAQDAASADVPATVSEEAKKRAQAAKIYIENMYKNQHQNVQERSSR